VIRSERRLTAPVAIGEVSGTKLPGSVKPAATTSPPASATLGGSRHTPRNCAVCCELASNSCANETAVQKTLKDTNIKLDSAFSDVMGLTSSNSG
jgi:hypothetical protein